jgi:hypothetical protein
MTAPVEFSVSEEMRIFREKTSFSHVVCCDETALRENPAPEGNPGLKRTQTNAIL